ncbi:MAG: hypothetical protein K2I83_02370, partial [Bacteroidales bacterium]|nr:hypothetical protein [Bacteroidales bacterium]
MKHRDKPIRIKLSPAQKDAIYALPLSLQFRIVYMNVGSGCAVYQHILVDVGAPDYAQILAVAKAYAAETDCWINPEVDRRAVVARKKLFQDLPAHLSRSNPDLTTRKYGYIDVKSPLNKSNIVRNVNMACAQGAIAVITDLALEKEEISLEELNKFTERIFSEHNRNHLGGPNYIKQEVHWFIQGH